MRSCIETIVMWWIFYVYFNQVEKSEMLCVKLGPKGEFKAINTS